MSTTACRPFQLQSEKGLVAAGPPDLVQAAPKLAAARSLTAACSTTGHTSQLRIQSPYVRVKTTRARARIPRSSLVMQRLRMPGCTAARARGSPITNAPATVARSLRAGFHEVDLEVPRSRYGCLIKADRSLRERPTRLAACRIEPGLRQQLRRGNSGYG